jgi:hypothetical protein
MTKELREKVADKIYHCKIQYRKSSDVADEIINLILDEALKVANAVHEDHIQDEDSFICGKYKAIEAIEQLQVK